MEYSDCRDSYVFCQAGLKDAYETIGNYNLFMVCETPDAGAFRGLPGGYLFRLCGRGELEAWKRIVVKEQYVSFVSEFYNKVYSKEEDAFFRRCTFVCETGGAPVASCFLWRAYGTIDTVAWFRVLPAHEGKGLGRALLSEILKTADCPVYLHTQPTSICAIKLYSDFGFKLITNPVIGYRKNDLAKSLPYMKKAMPEADYAKLQFAEVDDTLHKAALSSETVEF